MVLVGQSPLTGPGPAAIQALSSSSASQSATTVPMGGIWLDGRRDFARVSRELSSGRPACTIREVPAGADGTTQWPGCPSVVAIAAGVHPARQSASCCRNRPSDANRALRVVAAAAVGRQVPERGALPRIAGGDARRRGHQLRRRRLQPALAHERGKRHHVRRQRLGVRGKRIAIGRQLQRGEAEDLGARPSRGRRGTPRRDGMLWRLPGATSATLGRPSGGASVGVRLLVVPRVRREHPRVCARSSTATASRPCGPRTRTPSRSACRRGSPTGSTSGDVDRSRRRAAAPSAAWRRRRSTADTAARRGGWPDRQPACRLGVEPVCERRPARCERPGAAASCRRPARLAGRRANQDAALPRTQAAGPSSRHCWVPSGGSIGCGHAVLHRRQRLQVGEHALMSSSLSLPSIRTASAAAPAGPCPDACPVRIVAMNCSSVQSPRPGFLVGGEIGGEAHAPGAGPRGHWSPTSANPRAGGHGRRRRHHQVLRVAGERPRHVHLGTLRPHLPRRVAVVAAHDVDQVLAALAPGCGRPSARGRSAPGAGVGSRPARMTALAVRARVAIIGRLDPHLSCLRSRLDDSRVFAGRSLTLSYADS